MGSMKHGPAADVKLAVAETNTKESICMPNLSTSTSGIQLGML
jgi:hypothetical protein